MTSLYIPLNLPFSFYKEPFPFKKHCKRHTFFESNDINLDYINFISDLNLTLDHAEVFFSVPKMYYQIHKDQHDITDFPKINFVIGGKDSVMNWYKPKTLTKIKPAKTVLGLDFIGFLPEEVDLIYQKEIISPCIVQAGVPHNVTSPSERWCISTVYRFKAGKKQDKFLNWKEITEVFKEFIIDE